MKRIIKRVAIKLAPKSYGVLVSLKANRISQRFKRDYPSTQIFECVPNNSRKLHSYDNQDYIVYENFFAGKTDGFYCDIGGNHPISINNTLYFEELGWRGIAFEPLPHMAALSADHRKAKLFPVALSDEEGDLAFTIVKGAEGWENMLSFVKDTRDGVGGYDTEEIQVKSKVFKNIARDECIKHINYLSLDVEGHELNVLRGIDSSEVEIDVLTVENCPPESRVYGDENIRKIMFDNNFELWGRIVGLDDIYVNKDFLATSKQSGSGAFLCPQG